MTYSKQKGFTLIEVMIVVVVVAILASIAYPSYLEQVRKTKRSEVASALMEGAQALERHFTIQRSYLVGANVAPVFATAVPASGAANYTIAAAGSANAFTLTATPVNTMVGDACGTYTINQAGVRAVTGSLGVARCW